jgi:hypothetical protein
MQASTRPTECSILPQLIGQLGKNRRLQVRAAGQHVVYCFVPLATLYTAHDMSAYCQLFPACLSILLIILFATVSESVFRRVPLISGFVKGAI